MKTLNKPYAVAATWHHAGYEAGEIISRHSTYDLALNAIKRSGHDGQRTIRDLDAEDYQKQDADRIMAACLLTY